MTNDELYKRIMVMPSVKNAITYMNDSNITKSDLAKLCKRYNVDIEIKVTKEKMIDIFVKSTVGVKLAKKATYKYCTK